MKTIGKQYWSTQTKLQKAKNNKTEYFGQKRLKEMVCSKKSYCIVSCLFVIEDKTTVNRNSFKNIPKDIYYEAVLCEHLLFSCAHFVCRPVFLLDSYFSFRQKIAIPCDKIYVSQLVILWMFSFRIALSWAAVWANVCKICLFYYSTSKLMKSKLSK